jgi:hypothetical protein
METILEILLEQYQIIKGKSAYDALILLMDKDIEEALGLIDQFAKDYQKLLLTELAINAYADGE